MIIDNLTIAGFISSIAAVVVLLAGIRDTRRSEARTRMDAEGRKPCGQG